MQTRRLTSISGFKDTQVVAVCGSYYCLLVDLDDLIAGMDLPGQVRWRLEGKTNKETGDTRSKFKQTRAAY